LFSSAVGTREAAELVDPKLGKKKGNEAVRVIICFFVSPSTCSSLGVR
jgi:hypothetical protein